MFKLFSNRSIAVKLAAMTIVGAVCMALVATTVLLIARSQLLAERTEKAHAIVDAVWQLADGYQKMAASGKIRSRVFEPMPSAATSKSYRPVSPSVNTTVTASSPLSIVS